MAQVVPMGPLRTDFVNPFLQAASEVLTSEIGEDPERGEISLQPSASTTRDVTAVIGVLGQVTGIVLLGLDEPTACAIVARILNQPVSAFDEMAESAMGELANVIVGRAATLLGEAGLASNVTPPTLIVGRGTRLSTLSYQRLIIPLNTSLGDLAVEVALKPAKT